MKPDLKQTIRTIALRILAGLLFSGCGSNLSEDSGYGYFHISAVKAAEMMETGDVMVLDARLPRGSVQKTDDGRDRLRL